MQYIKRDDVKVSAVPFIEGLTVHDFLEYARFRPSLIKFLPNERDWVHMDRHWICDLLYSLDTDGIQAMIDNATVLRK